MKKALIFLGAVLLLAVTAPALTAQPFNYQEKPFYKGVTVGINIANIDESGTGSIARFNAGILGGYRLGKRLAFQGELLYSCVGASVDHTLLPNVSEEDELHLNLNYITVPITAKFFITRTLNVYAGGQIGFLVSQKFNYRGDKEKSDFKTNTVDFTVPVGIGFDWNRLMLGFRYQFGTTEIFKGGQKLSGKNSVYAINLGYKF